MEYFKAIDTKYNRVARIWKEGDWWRWQSCYSDGSGLEFDHCTTYKQCKEDIKFSVRFKKIELPGCILGMNMKEQTVKDICEEITDIKRDVAILKEGNKYNECSFGISELPMLKKALIYLQNWKEEKQNPFLTTENKMA